MRTLNQLYILLLAEYKTGLYTYICNVVSNSTKFTAEERHALQINIEANKPSDKQHAEFLTESWRGTYAWWYGGDTQVRIDFIKKMIKITTQQPKTIAELACQIEAGNEAFNAATKAEKRVKIAQDTIQRIKFRQLLPEHVGFAWIKNFPEKKGKSIKAILGKSEEPVCEVCAKGGLFMSYIGRVNETTFEDTVMHNDADAIGTKRLLEIFSLKQLASIEFAYEGFQGTGQGVVSFSWREESRALNFEKRYKDSKERLIAICENIIRNKGTFKL